MSVQSKFRGRMAQHCKLIRMLSLTFVLKERDRQTDRQERETERKKEEGERERDRLLLDFTFRASC